MASSPGDPADAPPRPPHRGGNALYWIAPLAIVVGLFLILLMIGREDESAFIYTLF
ncbi:MAG: hypothetical protein ACE5IL_16680 [Myxococcota bacterium]